MLVYFIIFLLYNYEISINYLIYLYEKYVF